MNKWMELLVGLILVLVPIVAAFYSQTWGIWNFWTAAGEFFKGGIFWFFIMIGALFILLGISDLKESTNNSKPPRPASQASAPAINTPVAKQRGRPRKQ